MRALVSSQFVRINSSTKTGSDFFCAGTVLVRHKPSARIKKPSILHARFAVFGIFDKCRGSIRPCSRSGFCNEPRGPYLLVCSTVFAIFVGREFCLPSGFAGSTDEGVRVPRSTVLEIFVGQSFIRRASFQVVRPALFLSSLSRISKRSSARKRRRTSAF